MEQDPPKFPPMKVRKTVSGCVSDENFENDLVTDAARNPQESSTEDESIEDTTSEDDETVDSEYSEENMEQDEMTNLMHNLTTGEDFEDDSEEDPDYVPDQSDTDVSGIDSDDSRYETNSSGSE